MKTKYYKAKTLRLLSILLFSISVSSEFIHAEIYKISPGDNSQEELQELLILAKPGDAILLREGTYAFTDGLSLNQSHVTILGQGMDKTILDFSSQKSGAQGLLVSSDEVILKDFAIINAVGDGIKVVNANGIYFINIRTEWTNGPNTHNGAYGLYPVQSKNVFIQGCVAIGASDAGIYVGQSENIIVRNNIAKFNVAGIEIENSYYADVYNNKVSDNTGGILVFDLPDLPQQQGQNIRVFNNISNNNNTDNFAPAGNIVSNVPRGTGVLILGSKNVEIFENEIGDNETINLAIVSYFEETDDPHYYPHPRSITVNNNAFSNSGSNPDIKSNEIAKILNELADGDMPDIFWDGFLPLSLIIFGQPNNESIIYLDIDNASFLKIDSIKFLLPFLDAAIRDHNNSDDERQPLGSVLIDVPWERID